MEVEFASTFAKSLKRLIWQESILYKFYSFFRYTAPRFCKNVWKYRKPLTNSYWWDQAATLEFLKISIAHSADMIEKHGNEIDESRLKKVAAMRRTAELIKNYNEDNYIEMAEAELGDLIHHGFQFEDVPDQPGYSRLVDLDTPEEAAHNRKVYDRSTEIGQQEWHELWSLLKGQDINEYRKISDAATEEEKKKGDLYDNWFDGSGINGWWD